MIFSNKTLPPTNPPGARPLMYPSVTSNSTPKRSSALTWRLTGRAPMAQPPGNETSASCARANSGPNTTILARIVLTRSYGATTEFSVDASNSTEPVSSSRTSTPIRPNNWSMVVTSFKCGKFSNRTFPGTISAAARIGKAAFFAPLTLTSPLKRRPPRIKKRSILKYPIPVADLFREASAR